MHRLWKWLEYYDQTLFLKINRDASNAFFDATLPWLRESSFWIPLYLFMAIFVLYNFGWRGLIWAAGFGIAVAMTDQLSSHVIKYAFMRLRPCQDPFFEPYIQLRARYCPGNPSFTSSHAANHFAIAAYVYYAGKLYLGKQLRWFFAWAALISISQVYVGVHYPLDIVGGALLGWGIGWLVANVYKRHFSLLPPGQLPQQVL